MAPKKRIDQPLTSWMQDAINDLNRIHDMLLSGEIDEADLDRERRYDLEISCRSAMDAVEGAFLDLREQSASERTGDTYAGLRHQQNERL